MLMLTFARALFSFLPLLTLLLMFIVLLMLSPLD